MPVSGISAKKKFSVTGVWLFAVLVVISVVFVTIFSRESENGLLHSVENAIYGIAAPFRLVGAQAYTTETDILEVLQNKTTDKATYNELRKENEKLRAAAIELEEYHKEALRLEELLDLKDRYNFEVVTGRVVGISADSWDKVISLGIGSEDGVELGLPVVSGSGLVGQVIKVNPSSCDVRLISDALSGVSVRLQEQRASGLLSGSSDGLLYLTGVDDSVGINVGDSLITSGLGGTYFAGIPVGTVASIDEENGTSLRRIVLTPLCNIAAIEEAAVIVGWSDAGIEAASESDATSHDVQENTD